MHRTLGRLVSIFLFFLTIETGHADVPKVRLCLSGKESLAEPMEFSLTVRQQTVTVKFSRGAPVGAVQAPYALDFVLPVGPGPGEELPSVRFGSSAVTGDGYVVIRTDLTAYCMPSRNGIVNDKVKWVGSRLIVGTRQVQREVRELAKEGKTLEEKARAFSLLKSSGKSWAQLIRPISQDEDRSNLVYSALIGFENYWERIKDNSGGVQGAQQASAMESALVYQNKQLQDIMKSGYWSALSQVVQGEARAQLSDLQGVRRQQLAAKVKRLPKEELTQNLAQYR